MRLPFFYQRSGQNGFALIEALVGIFTLGALSVAVFNLASVGTKTSLESERQVVASGILNQHVERVRSLAYDAIGYNTGAQPDGVLPPTENVIQSGQTYAKLIVVTLVDDPLNGTVGSLTENNADLKKVQVTIGWTNSSGVPKSVAAVTYVARVVAATPTPSPTPSPSPTPIIPTPSPSPMSPPVVSDQLYVTVINRVTRAPIASASLELTVTQGSINPAYWIILNALTNTGGQHTFEANYPLNGSLDVSKTGYIPVNDMPVISVFNRFVTVELDPVSTIPTLTPTPTPVPTPTPTPSPIVPTPTISPTPSPVQYQLGVGKVWLQFYNGPSGQGQTYSYSEWINNSAYLQWRATCAKQGDLGWRDIGSFASITSDTCTVTLRSTTPQVPQSLPCTISVTVGPNRRLILWGAISGSGQQPDKPPGDNTSYCDSYDQDTNERITPSYLAAQTPRLSVQQVMRNVSGIFFDVSSLYKWEGWCDTATPIGYPSSPTTVSYNGLTNFSVHPGFSNVAIGSGLNLSTADACAFRVRHSTQNKVACWHGFSGWFSVSVPKNRSLRVETDHIDPWATGCKVYDTSSGALLYNNP